MARICSRTVGDRSFCSAGLRLQNSLPSFLRARTLACTDAAAETVIARFRSYYLATHATPGTVYAQLSCNLLVNHFDGSCLISFYCLLLLMRRNSITDRAPITFDIAQLGKIEKTIRHEIKHHTISTTIVHCLGTCGISQLGTGFPMPARHNTCYYTSAN